MKDRSRSGPRARRGSSAIEFAFLLPVILALVLGMIDFGWYFVQESQVVAAVREGVRLGVTYETTDSPDPAAAAEARVTEVLTEHGLTTGVVVDSAYAGSSPEQLLTVSVTMPYEPLLDFVPLPLTLHSSMTMLLELQD